MYLGACMCCFVCVCAFVSVLLVLFSPLILSEENKTQSLVLIFQAHTAGFSLLCSLLCL